MNDYGTIYIGIDPGIQGAIAAIHPNTQPYILPLPIIQKDDHNYYDCLRLTETFLPLVNKPHLVLVERPLYFSRQSTAGQTLSFINYGRLLAVCELIEVNYTEVTPQAWHKDLFEKGIDSKVASVAYCQKEYPAVSLLRTKRARKPDHNYADALCIAHYAKMKGMI